MGRAESEERRAKGQNCLNLILISRLVALESVSGLFLDTLSRATLLLFFF